MKEFARINGKLDVLDKALRGNGRIGINTRLDRLEQKHAMISRAVWIMVGVLGSLLLNTVYVAVVG